MLRKALLLVALLLSPVLAFGQVSEAGKPVKQVFDADITGITCFHSDTVYVLNGFVFVDSGEVLVIQPGTIVKSQPGTGANATALIVSRSGKLFAEGTETAPIIFTALADDVDNPTDLPDDASSKGLWGGVVLLGITDVSVAGDSSFIEGIPVATYGPRITYGPGTKYTGNDNDNSGVMRYVSIRYPGSVLAPNNEINGLTFGAVGRGTTIDHIEVYYSADDDYEWFGGTVNCYYLVGAFGDDDCFDTDEGYRGIRQFAFEIKDPRWGDRLTENDGGNANCFSCTPYARAVLTNATLIGQGATGSSGGTRDRMIWRDYAGAYVYNNVFTQVPKDFLEIEVKGGDAGIDGITSSTRWLPSGQGSLIDFGGTPQLDFVNNIFYAKGNAGPAIFGIYSTGDSTTTPLATARVRNDLFGVGRDTAATGKNQLINPLLTNISYTRTGTLDPRPTGGSPLVGTATALPAYAKVNGPVSSVSYRGAFEPGKPLWTDRWTALSFYGYTPSPTPFAVWSGVTQVGKPVKQIADSNITGITTFYRDTVYELNGFCFVDSGEALVIEPGTVVKGAPGTGANATALIVSRVGRLYALGSEDFPVVFTAEADDVDNPTDLPDIASSKGLWGGVVLLGRTNISVAGDSSFIEGIPVATYGPRITYGPGTKYNGNDNDNSGVMRYVSIRYPGSVLAPNNEINGLTFGAVGRATRIDHIEVFYSADDSYEWFGGTVNCRYLASGFDDDDCFDTDEGYRGVRQFAFEIKDPRWGDRLTENDGGNANCFSCTPYARAVLTNATLIGQGATGSSGGTRDRMIWRDYAGAYVYNNIFTEVPKDFLEIEVKGGDAGIDGITSSTRWLPSGQGSLVDFSGTPQLDFQKNFFYRAGNAGSTRQRIYSTGDSTTAPLATARVRGDVFTAGDTTIAGKNQTIDPNIRFIDWTRSQKLDPRVKATGPAATGSAAVPAYADPSGFVQSVPYRGAFNPNDPLDGTWIWRWSFLASGGFLGTNGVPPSCCVGVTGNVDGDPLEGIDISDLSALIDFLYISFTPPACMAEANTDGDIGGGVDISDLSALIDFLYISFTPTATCQ
jgi:hypothetical protein